MVLPIRPRLVFILILRQQTCSYRQAPYILSCWPPEQQLPMEPMSGTTQAPILITQAVAGLVLQLLLPPVMAPLGLDLVPVQITIIPKLPSLLQQSLNLHRHCSFYLAAEFCSMFASGVQLKAANPLMQEQLPVEQWGTNTPVLRNNSFYGATLDLLPFVTSHSVVQDRIRQSSWRRTSSPAPPRPDNPRAP